MMKISNFIEIDSIDYFIQEIKKAIDSKLYLSALHLSLTLPDILGKLQYPEYGEKQSKQRFIRWFNENVYDSFGRLPTDKFFEGVPKIDGENVYQLRCKLFHESHNDIKEDTGINEFVLSFTDQSFLTGDVAGSTTEVETGKEFKYLYVSCLELTNYIINAAIMFKNDKPNYDYPKLKINKHGGKFPSFIIGKNY